MSSDFLGNRHLVTSMISVVVIGLFKRLKVELLTNLISGGFAGGILLTIWAGAEVKKMLNWLAISAGVVYLIPLQNNSEIGFEKLGVGVNSSSNKFPSLF